MEPAVDGSVWEFSVDINNDSTTEGIGSLDQLESIDYSVGEVGVHEIVVVWTRGPVTVVDTLFAIVNDTSIGTLKNFLDRPSTGSVEGIRFIAPFLYTTGALAIQQRDAEALEVISEITLPENVGNSLHGLASATDGLLYAANQHEILEIRVPEMELVRTVPTEISSAFFIDVVGRERIYVGDSNEISVIDANDGTVMAMRTILSGMNHFDVDDEGSRLAVARGFGSRSLLMLDARTFADLWEIQLNDGEPQLLSFGPNGELLYVLGWTGGEIHFFAVDARDGDLLRSFVLEPCPETCFREIGANPVTRLGPYVVIVTLNGAYLIDTQTQLPVYRIDPVEGTVLLTCCNVASDDASLFFARLDNAVFSVALKNETD